jgi:hypothetical protein
VRPEVVRIVDGDPANDSPWVSRVSQMASSDGWWASPSLCTYGWPLQISRSCAPRAAGMSPAVSAQMKLGWFTIAIAPCARIWVTAHSSASAIVENFSSAWSGTSPMVLLVQSAFTWMG